MLLARIQSTCTTLNRVWAKSIYFPMPLQFSIKITKTILRKIKTIRSLL